MFLTAGEIAELTAKQKPHAQARELAALGIAFKTRRDGSLVVLREHVAAVLGGTYAKPAPVAPEPQLRF